MCALEMNKMNPERKEEYALAGVAQWIECCPANQRVTI